MRDDEASSYNLGRDLPLCFSCRHWRPSLVRHGRDSGWCAYFSAPCAPTRSCAHWEELEGAPHLAVDPADLDGLQGRTKERGAHAISPEEVIEFDRWRRGLRAEQKAPPNPYARTIRVLALVDGERKLAEVTIDWYTVATAYGLTHPLAHAGKKLIDRGTGEKSRTQELREAIASIERAIEMEEES